MLRAVVDYGTGRTVRELGVTGPVAGKTGTTNEGNALLSELEQAAVTARNESTMRFDTAPPRQLGGAP